MGTRALSTLGTKVTVPSKKLEGVIIGYQTVNGIHSVRVREARSDRKVTVPATHVVLAAVCGVCKKYDDIVYNCHYQDPNAKGSDDDDGDDVRACLKCIEDTTNNVFKTGAYRYTPDSDDSIYDD